VDIWRATWEMFKARPLAGVGMGGYWAAIPERHDASGEYTPQQAHNDYLELLASGGLVGFALLLWFVFALLRRARSVARVGGDPFRRAALYGALAGLFGIAVHSLFDFGLHLTANAALFVALVVVATADVQPAEAVGPTDRVRRTRAA
jgi:O-antigen ligase